MSEFYSNEACCAGFITLHEIAHVFVNCPALGYVGVRATAAWQQLVAVATDDAAIVAHDDLCSTVFTYVFCLLAHRTSTCWNYLRGFLLCFASFLQQKIHDTIGVAVTMLPFFRGH